jgi:CTP synthase
MRLGAWPCRLAPGSLVQDVYGGAEEISERHRHRYEFNPEFRQRLEKEGWCSAVSRPTASLWR